MAFASAQRVAAYSGTAPTSGRRQQTSAMVQMEENRVSYSLAIRVIMPS